MQFLIQSQSLAVKSYQHSVLLHYAANMGRLEINVPTKKRFFQVAGAGGEGSVRRREILNTSQCRKALNYAIVRGGDLIDKRVSAFNSRPHS